VSPETLLLVQRSLEGHAVTGGRFDPTLLGAVLRAGYVTTFDERTSTPRLAGRSALVTGAHRIEVDAVVGTVRIPDGVGFDPGGVGKGLAADLVTGELLAAGAAGACVNVGGDLRVGGVAPDERAWRIDVDDPWGAADPVARLRVRAGAVATSSRLRRHWATVDGVERHHLIDPATDDSVRSAVVAVTVVAAEGWQAEVLTKAVFLDPEGGMALVDALGAAAHVTTDDGATATAGWSDFTAPTLEEVPA
jgi:thiamine biosynthesis lipoprotein